MTPSRTPALTFIFITLLIDVIGLGIIIPIMPDLIIELAHLDPKSSEAMAYASKMGAGCFLLMLLFSFYWLLLLVH